MFCPFHCSSASSGSLAKAEPGCEANHVGGEMPLGRPPVSPIER